MSTEDVQKMDDIPSSSDNKHLSVKPTLQQIHQEQSLINGQTLQTLHTNQELMGFSEEQNTNKIDREQQTIRTNQHDSYTQTDFIATTTGEEQNNLLNDYHILSIFKRQNKIVVSFKPQQSTNKQIDRAQETIEATQVEKSFHRSIHPLPRCESSVLTARVNSQLCRGIPQYGRCSSNTACGCFHMEGAPNIGVCGFQWVDCLDLNPCDLNDGSCPEADQICVKHPRCSTAPVCYPASMIQSTVCPSTKPASTTSTATTATTTEKSVFVPLRASKVDIPPNPKWQTEGITVAEGYILPDGTNATNNLYYPMGIFVADDETFYVTDPNNNRVMELKSGVTTGKVAAGGNGRGNEANQLSGPTDVIVDKQTESLIICDNNNKRVVQWPRVGGKSGETIIPNVNCYGITMDEDRTLYTVGYDTDEVKRFRKGETQGTVVAGGNGRGNAANQLNWPQYIFVDRDRSIYVTEWYSNRVTKWVEGAKEGIVVAGGNGRGNALNQLAGPQGVLVDQSGAVYVGDGGNGRVVRWPKGAIEGIVIAGGNGSGKQANQLAYSYGISFDRQGNLYVVDHWNSRVQKFNIV
ncbi:unnamed protein product [Rotaria sp. Silwood2]|nr:unnamed protein product [Rotaria sp. Silwood2]